MKTTLIFAVVLLIAAAGLIVYGSTRIPEPTFHGKLADLLPEPPPGWTMVKKAIADTPEMKAAVDELLNYDDGVFVDYTNGTDRLSVYIAYWTPGRMSQRLVASHTPDVCWVGNGWQNEKSSVVDGLRAAGRVVAPAESRRFSINGTTEYVWFWHTVGGETKSYSTGSVPPWYAPLTDMLRKGLNQREEQFFIRVSSRAPLNSEGLNVITQSVLEGVAPHIFP